LRRWHTHRVPAHPALTRFWEINGRYREVVTAPCAGRHRRLLPLCRDDWHKALSRRLFSPIEADMRDVLFEPKGYRWVGNPAWLERPDVRELPTVLDVDLIEAQLLQSVHKGVSV
jgi:hypothetical protein